MMLIDLLLDWLFPPKVTVTAGGKHWTDREGRKHFAPSMALWISLSSPPTEGGRS